MKLEKFQKRLGVISKLLKFKGCKLLVLEGHSPPTIQNLP